MATSFLSQVIVVCQEKVPHSSYLMHCHLAYLYFSVNLEKAIQTQTFTRPASNYWHIKQLLKTGLNTWIPTGFSKIDCPKIFSLRKNIWWYYCVTFWQSVSLYICSHNVLKWHVTKVVLWFIFIPFFWCVSMFY